MTAVYPTNIVSTSNITDANPLTTLSANNHAGKHNDLRDEIIALETKVGKDGSAVTTTHDYKLSGVTGTDKAVGATQTVSMSNKTMISPKVTVTGDAVGDTLYNSSGSTGVQSRIPIGSVGQFYTSNGTNPYWSSPSSTNTNYAADTGAANAYIVTLSPALGAYAAGVLVQFKAANANTTTSTVNVNSLGIVTIKKLGGATNLASGDIAAGMVVELEYDGTNFVMLNPVANAPLTSVIDTGFLTSSSVDVVNDNSASEVTMFTYALTGGILSTNKGVRLRGTFTFTNNSSTTSASFFIKYGGTIIGSFGDSNASVTNFTGTYVFDCVLMGAGTTSTQEATTMEISSGASVVTPIAQTTLYTSSIDSTVSQNIVITSQMSSAAVGRTVTLKNLFIQKVI